nr:MAG TPA: hypothetical protein [Caudoviricetes sp.]
MYQIGYFNIWVKLQQKYMKNKREEGILPPPLFYSAVILRII